MRGSPATETTCLFAPRPGATDAVEIEACSIRAAAERLREAAALFAHQNDNAYRVAAYRRAADAVL